MAELFADRLQPTARVPQPQVEAPRQETNRNPRRRPGSPKAERADEAEDPDTPPHQIDDLA